MSDDKSAAFSLHNLEAIIALRAGESGEKSYTRSLMDKGISRAAEKLGEEAVEAVIAAVSQDDKAMRGEAADILFHLLVVLNMRGISLDDVLMELHSRTGQSGHAEKASRK
jgi:phosphoribosyl-ATP pyrophosphohydrolase